MNKNIIEMIAAFMERTQLSGKEVETYSACMNALKEAHAAADPVAVEDDGAELMTDGHTE